MRDVSPPYSTEVKLVWRKTTEARKDSDIYQGTNVVTKLTSLLHLPLLPPDLAVAVHDISVKCAPQFG